MEKGEIVQMSNFTFFTMFSMQSLKSFNKCVAIFQLSSAVSLNLGQSQNGV